MIAPLEVVKGMELEPQACVLCANNPLDEETGQQKPAIFAPGVDVNWGNSVYICWSCGEIIADLMGRSTRAGFDRLEEENKELVEERDTLELKYNKAKEILEKVAAGRKAEKQAQKEAA